MSVVVVSAAHFERCLSEWCHVSLECAVIAVHWGVRQASERRMRHEQEETEAQRSHLGKENERLQVQALLVFAVFGTDLEHVVGSLCLCGICMSVCTCVRMQLCVYGEGDLSVGLRARVEVGSGDLRVHKGRVIKV